MLENFSFVKKSVNLGTIVQDLDPDPDPSFSERIQDPDPYQN